MTTITEFKTEQGDFLAVVVPEDAQNIRLIPHQKRNTIDQEDSLTLEWDSPRPIHNFTILSQLKNGSVILGTLHYDGEYHWGFDPSVVVDRTIIRTECHVRATGYRDYDAFINYTEKDQYKHHFLASEDSFISLLQSKGINFVNPLGTRPTYKGPRLHAGFETDRDKEMREEFEKELDEWRAAEQSLVKGKLVILKRNQ